MASPGLSEAESHSNAPQYSLENILGDDHDKLEHPDVRPEGWDEEGAEREAENGYCVECEGAWSDSSFARHFTYPIYCIAQTNPQKCAAKHAWTTIAMYASLHSIERAAAKGIPQNLF